VIVPQYPGSQQIDDFLKGRLSGFHQGASDNIGIDDVGAQIAENLSDGRFSGTHATSQAG